MAQKRKSIRKSRIKSRVKHQKSRKSKKTQLIHAKSRIKSRKSRRHRKSRHPTKSRKSKRHPKHGKSRKSKKVRPKHVKSRRPTKSRKSKRHPKHAKSRVNKRSKSHKRYAMMRGGFGGGDGAGGGGFGGGGPAPVRRESFFAFIRRTPGALTHVRRAVYIKMDSLLHLLSIAGHGDASASGIASAQPVNGAWTRPALPELVNDRPKALQIADNIVQLCTRGSCDYGWVGHRYLRPDNWEEMTRIFDHNIDADTPIHDREYPSAGSPYVMTDKTYSYHVDDIFPGWERLGNWATHDLEGAAPGGWTCVNNMFATIAMVVIAQVSTEMLRQQPQQNVVPFHIECGRGMPYNALEQRERFMARHQNFHSTKTHRSAFLELAVLASFYQYINARDAAIDWHGHNQQPSPPASHEALCMNPRSAVRIDWIFPQPVDYAHVLAQPASAQAQRRFDVGGHLSIIYPIMFWVRAVDATIGQPAANQIGAQIMNHDHPDWTGIGTQFQNEQEFLTAVADRDHSRGDGGLWNAFWGAPEQLPFFQMIDICWHQQRHLQQDSTFGWVDRPSLFIWNEQTQTWDAAHHGDGGGGGRRGGGGGGWRRGGGGGGGGRRGGGGGGGSGGGNWGGGYGGRR